jgi:hypothetical protein
MVAPGCERFREHPPLLDSIQTLRVRVTRGTCHGTEGKPFPCVSLHRDDWGQLMRERKVCCLLAGGTDERCQTE